MDNMIEHLAPFCPNQACGDPILSPQNEIVFTKRKMSLSGRSWLGEWVFICPVCGGKRRFRPSYFGNEIIEV